MFEMVDVVAMVGMVEVVEVVKVVKMVEVFEVSDSNALQHFPYSHGPLIEKLSHLKIINLNRL